MKSKSCSKKEKFKLYGGVAGCIVGILIIVLGIVVVKGLIGDNRKLVYLDSSSMKGSIEDNSLLLISKDDFNNLSVDDIVSFYRNDERVVHRVVEKTTENGELAFVTNGDNNAEADNGYLTENSYEGKVEKIICSGIFLLDLLVKAFVFILVILFVIFMGMWILIGIKVGKVIVYKKR